MSRRFRMSNRSRSGLKFSAGLIVIAAVFAGVAISDRSAATRIVPVVPRKPGIAAVDDPSARTKQAVTSTEEGTVPSLSARAIRRKGSCVGCGVVESTRRIDRTEIAGGGCSFASFEPAGMPENSSVGDRTQAVRTLASGNVHPQAEQACGKRTSVSSNYQIVVRLPDGSRRVFDEVTPRSFRAGERIQLIGAAAPPAE